VKEGGSGREQQSILRKKRGDRVSGTLGREEDSSTGMPSLVTNGICEAHWQGKIGPAYDPGMSGA